MASTHGLLIENNYYLAVASVDAAGNRGNDRDHRARNRALQHECSSSAYRRTGE